MTDFYAFVETIEPVWAPLGEEPTNGQAAPDCYWFELDCIEAQHFDQLVRDPPPRLDHRELNEADVRQRIELQERLTQDRSRLAAVYLFAGRNAVEREGLLELFLPSSWHALSVRQSNKEVDLTSPDLQTIDPDESLGLIAKDLYTQRAWVLDKWESEPPQRDRLEALREVFSLNHIPDIQLGGGEEPGGVAGNVPLLQDGGGQPPQEAPPIQQAELGLLQELSFSERHAYRFRNANLVFYPGLGYWKLWWKGKAFVSRALGYETVWITQDENTAFVLVQHNQEAYFLPHHKLMSLRQRLHAKHSVRQVHIHLNRNG